MNLSATLNVDTLEGLEALSPLEIASFHPKSSSNYGLIIVDAVNGFCTPGRGPLAPVEFNAQIKIMIDKIDDLAKIAVKKALPILALRDSHRTDQNEAPYPPHCLEGTGDDELVDQLLWLKSAPNTEILAKNCINGVIGGIRSSRNVVFDWIIDGVERKQIDTLLVTGICTDICVLGLVVALLSARTRNLIGDIKEIVVLEEACATYDLSLKTARELGLPDKAAHPQELYHQMGLRIMQNQGALIVR